MVDTENGRGFVLMNTLHDLSVTVPKMIKDAMLGKPQLLCMQQSNHRSFETADVNETTADINEIITRKFCFRRKSEFPFSRCIISGTKYITKTLFEQEKQDVAFLPLFRTTNGSLRLFAFPIL